MSDRGTDEKNLTESPPTHLQVCAGRSYKLGITLISDEQRQRRPVAVPVNQFALRARGNRLL